jgi:hypothetical protein
MVGGVALSGCGTRFSVNDGSFLISFGAPDTVVERATELADVSDATRLDVRSFGGDIEVTINSARSDAMVEIVRSVSERDQQKSLEALDGIEATIGVADGTLTVRARRGNGLDPAINAAAHLHIQLPRGMAMDLRTEAGLIRVSGNDQPISARTDRGMIEVTSHSGDVDVETDDGDVILTDVRSGSIEANTARGNIMAVVTLAEAGDVDLRTERGDVTLEIPSDTKTSIELNARGGRINFDLEAFTVRDLRVSERLVEAELNDGGGSIRAETDAGTIHFSAR